MSNDYVSLGAPTSGTGWLADLVLTGWSGTLATKSNNGRVYWRIVSGVLTIYSDPAMAAAIAGGTFSGLNVTLTAQNTSGITGTALAGLVEDGEGNAIISYADENDLNVFVPQLASFLTSSKWPGSTGGNRFEYAFGEAKRILDGWVMRGAGTSRVNSWRGAIDLTRLSTPRSLSQVHAKLTAWILQNRVAAMNEGGAREANLYYTDAERMFKGVALRWNTGDPNTVTYPLTQATMRRV